MLVHQKMTGHLMMGRWQKPTKKVLGQLDKKWEGEKWVPDPPQGPLAERMNRFIRLIFFFDDGKMMALSDIRRFAKVICGPRDFVLNLPDIKNLGPEPLGVGFTYEKFEKLFRGKRGKIKQVLMDPTFISGIGNIYADEILWSVRVYPLMPTESLNKRQIKAIYLSMREILKKAVRLRGTSIGDYRDAAGRLGRYGGERLAYGLEGEPCQRCRTKLKRIKMGGRSSTFCPNCQKP
jgi:formamidopyrimidine-DNA glycosylase